MFNAVVNKIFIEREQSDIYEQQRITDFVHFTASI